MQKILKISPLIFSISVAVAKDNVISAPTPRFFENEVQEIEPLHHPIPSAENISADKLILPENSSANQLEKAITLFLVQKNWQALKPLLTIYATQPQFDKILYQYALGALSRAEKNYSQAIELYQQIVHQNPELIYPRFDLGIMLFENKQCQ